MEMEKQQFREERNERQQLLVDRQNHEVQTFDQESVRLGLNALTLNQDNYDLVAGDQQDSVSGSMLSLAHSNSASSFTHTAL